MKPQKKLRLEGWGEWGDVIHRMIPHQRAYTEKAWRNRVYSARVYRYTNSHLKNGIGDALVISITRCDGKPIRGAHWKDLQKIKNDLGYSDHWACEWYPPEAETVDPANIYYLYLWPKDHPIPTSCGLKGVAQPWQ